MLDPASAARRCASPGSASSFERRCRCGWSRLADVIRRGVGQRAVQVRSPRRAASALVATIQGYFVLAATARNIIPRGSAAPHPRSAWPRGCCGLPVPSPAREDALMKAATNVATLSTPAKLGLLGSLYLSQGLPFGFFTQALPVLLRKHGLSLGADRPVVAARRCRGRSSSSGRRSSIATRSPRRRPARSWILPLQLAAVAVLAAARAARRSHSMPAADGRRPSASTCSPPPRTSPPTGSRSTCSPTRSAASATACRSPATGSA